MQRKYQKVEESKQFNETRGVESNPVEQWHEMWGDHTQPPKEALSVKVIDRNKEDVYPNKEETFKEEVSQDASVWSLIDRSPTLLGVIQELHLKWSRGHVPGGKEQEQHLSAGIDAAQISIT